MKPQNELALIVAYFLSRNDSRGHILLGYKTFAEAIKQIGEILDVKKNTIKNMRDEFDFHHQNSRVGWRRELRGSRMKVIETFQETDDDTLLEIVRSILSKSDLGEAKHDISLLFSEAEKLRGKTVKRKESSVFIVRGPTGRMAEDFFMDYFKLYQLPMPGVLIDTREMGCGYDFLIKKNDEEYFIEVKGLASENGGLLFTNKEWKIAEVSGDRYYVVVVKNISNKPEILIIQNPTLKLRAKINIFTTVQVSWNVSHKNLKSII